MIKKMFTCLMAAMMLVNCVPVFANEAYSDEEYIAETLMNAEPNNQGGFDFEEFYTIVDGNKFYAVDYEGNVLLTAILHTTAFSIKKASTSNMLLASNILLEQYDKFSSFDYITTGNIEFQHGNLSSVTTIAGLITTVLGSMSGGILFGVTALAGDIYERQADWVTYDYYLSSNQYCSILGKEKYEFYDDNGNYLRTVYTDYSWFGNPDNYSYPAACRVLKEKYPY